MNDPGMTIGAFARRTRLSLKALRLYEQLGLLTPADVGPQGYRRYGEDQLALARTIALLRRLDMPLAQVADVVAAGGERAADLVAAYWQEVESRHASRRELAIHLRIMLSGGTASAQAVRPEGFDIQQRSVAAQEVLTEQRHLRIDDLQPWRKAASRRLNAVAASCGGAAGPEFAIFHGAVDEDGDGPVELCVPIHSGQNPDHARRTEPAHREVYIRVTRARYEFPQILSVYDALESWLLATGTAMTAAPREVLVGLGASDPVCDVAYPIS